MRLTQSEFSCKYFAETLDDCIEQAYEQSDGDKDEFRKIFLENFYRYNSGLNVYIPKDPAGLKGKSARNSLIRKEFNGFNHSELSRKYGLSLQYIYKIVKKKLSYEID